MSFSSEDAPTSVQSPFGGAARLIQHMDVSAINEKYVAKCGLSVDRHFHGINRVFLYQCEATGYQFWRPQEIAGGESFYRELSAAWPNYYRLHRWEHKLGFRHLKGRAKLLEIGCGPGHFLRTLEGRDVAAVGIESNQQAVRDKVTTFPILPDIADVSRITKDGFDAIYAFQVLEHIADPCTLIRESMSLLRPGGILMFSTPNPEFDEFRYQRDPFDLPPHHIGHFSRDTYYRIAHKMGLRVLAMSVQGPVVAPKPMIALDPMTRLLRKAAALPRVLLRRTKGETGPNLLVTLGRS